MRLRASALSAVSHRRRRSPTSVLERLSIQPAAVRSVRRLVESYTGPALRVRRTSDSDEIDVPFGGDRWIDEALLLSFGGPGITVSVSAWYDQLSPTKNATQNTAALQPVLVDTAHTIQRMGSRPALRFAGSNMVYTNLTSQPFTHNSVHRLSSLVNGGHLTDGVTASPRPLVGYTTSYVAYAGGAAVLDMGPAAVNQNTINTTVFNGASSVGRINGVQSTGNPGTQGSATVMVGARSGGSTPVPMDGYIGEMIVFNAALSTADSVILEADQAAAFGVSLA